MKYKVGDKVKLREDLVVGDRYGGLTYLYFMKEELRYKGNVATITYTRVDSKGVIGYDLKGYSYTYSEEMIEGLDTDKKETNNMKYKVGDRVKIRKDLVVDEYYDEWVFTEEMEKDVKSNDYILTISKAYIAYDEETPVYQYEEDTHRTTPSSWELTEAMIEGLAEITESDKEKSDREKFEDCMRKLSSLNGSSETWRAFNRCVTHDPEVLGYDDDLKIISDYLFGVEKKRMTKAEIEAELGYEIEIVEE